MAGEPALRADVVLLVDTSASMAASRLDAVRLAAAYLLDQKNPELDHAAVIGFDRAPRTAVHMTADRHEIDRGLASLRSGSSSTRFDLAIAVARHELLYDGGERDFSNRGVIVMLSDGRHDGEANDAIAEAFFTGTAGFAIYAVGLGSDADQDLLNAIADKGAHYAVSHEAGLSTAFDAIGRHIRRSRGWCGSAWGADSANSLHVDSLADAGYPPVTQRRER